MLAVLRVQHCSARLGHAWHRNGRRRQCFADPQRVCRALSSTCEAPVPHSTKGWNAPAQKLLLVDGHSLAYRAYYSLVNDRSDGLMTSTGVPTSICHGFLKMLLVVMKQQNPHAIVVAFDFGNGTSIRRDLEPSYKSSREAAPKQMNVDMQNLRVLLRALGVHEAWNDGYEGDDIIATLAKCGAGQGYCVEILTNDADLLQLVDDTLDIKVLMLTSGGPTRRGFAYKEMRSHDVVEQYGVMPAQIADLKGLQGDKSDDIKGVRGIGPKTASKLLCEFGSIEELYNNLSSLTASQRKKLEEGRESAFLSKRLATVISDAPVGALQDLTNARISGFHMPSFKEHLTQLELNHLIGRLDEFQEVFGDKHQQPASLSSSNHHTANQVPS